MLIIEIEKRPNKMVDRIRYPTVSYLPFYYVFFQFLLLTIFNLQANILTTKDILSNLDETLMCLDCSSVRACFHFWFACVEHHYVFLIDFIPRGTWAPCVLAHWSDRKYVFERCKLSLSLSLNDLWKRTLSALFSMVIKFILWIN